jgi:hypothetical protein
VLYESCLFSDAHEAGLDPVEGYAAWLKKPASKAELEAALASLLAAARDSRRVGEIPRPPGSNAPPVRSNGPG